MPGQFQRSYPDENDTIARIRARFGRIGAILEVGDRRSLRCPLHDDTNPSFSIFVDRKGIERCAGWR